jgi:alkyl hydroperoxide reductase subunit AhpC
VLGISTDSVATHEHWLAASLADGGLGGLHFPLVADEDGTASRAYGISSASASRVKGSSRSSSFIIRDTCTGAELARFAFR